MIRGEKMCLKSRQQLKIFLLVFLSIFILSCMPTCLSYLSVNRILIVDEIPYLHTIVETEENCYSRESHYFVSNNNGKNWKEISSPPAEMPPLIEDPKDVHLMVCVPDQLDFCYRISGTDQVEISSDRGKTWQIDWTIPPGRQAYIERDAYITQLSNVSFDTIPFDLGIAVRENGYLVIDAMGNQGVLIKSTDGKWTRYPVSTQHKLDERYDQAYPPPFYASDMQEAAQAITGERDFSAFAATILFIALSLFGWKNIHDDKNFWRKLFKFSIPIPVSVLLLIGLLIFGFLNFSSQLGIAVEEGYIWLVPVSGLFISWIQIIHNSQRRKFALLSALTALGCAILFVICTWLPFILWAIGTIPFYESALVISILCDMIIIVLAIWGEKRIVTLAAQRVPASPENDTFVKG